MIKTLHDEVVPDGVEDSNQHDDNSYSGTVVTFEQRNGHCMPAESKARFRTGRESVLETPIYNTDLCRKLLNFFRREPSVNECFVYSLNQEVREILGSYEDRFFADGSRLWKTKEEVLQRTNQALTTPLNDSLRLQVFVGSARTDVNKQRKLRISPLAMAELIVMNCHFRGLARFYAEDKFRPVPK